MKKFIVPLIVCVCAVPALAGPDFNPPSWRGLPNSTTQGWDFIFGFTHAGDLADDRVVTMRNPNELPTNIVPGLTNPSSPNIVYVTRQRPNVSDTFITLLGTAPDVDYSRLLLGIPNFQSDFGVAHADSSDIPNRRAALDQCASYERPDRAA